MRNWLIVVALLAGTAALAEDELDLEEAPHFQPQTPWYLPRDVYVGAFFNGPDTFALRLSWEFVFAPERVDALGFALDAGGGWALSVPGHPDANGNPALDSFYEHTVQAGVGYWRTRREGFYWGAQITAGPEWYGATAPGLGTEHYLVGVIDGRVQIGVWLGGKVAVGISGGLSQPLSRPPPSFSYNYVGGGQLGFFCHWL